jgi:hypothetical protein
LQKLEASRPRPENPYQNKTPAERLLAVLGLYMKAADRSEQYSFHDRVEKRYYELRDYITLGKFDQRFEDQVERDLEVFREARRRHMANERKYPWPDEVPGA